MSDIKNFSVTLTDLGTYVLDVAAFDEQQACDIAKQVLHEHAFAAVDGLSIKARQTQATAILADPQPHVAYRVRFTQNVQHELRLPAGDRRRAIQHAEWLIANTGPLEFDMINERVEGLYAEALS
jgi:hypothetical protein